MTTDEVEQAIIAWRGRLGAASRNVVELSELPEFLSVKERLRRNALDGRTRDEARDLVAAMDELWQGVLLIGSTLNSADEARKRGLRGLFRTAAGTDEAAAILTGDSVELAVTDTPVLGRSLLGGTQSQCKVSLERLLTTMIAAFDKAKDTLARIGSGEADAKAAVAALRAEVAALVGTGWTGADAVAANLPDIEKLASSDPLGAIERIAAELRPAVDAAKAVAARSAADAKDADAAIAAAADKLRALDEADAKAAAAVRAALAKVDGVALAAPDGTDARELPGWLDRLRSNRKAGKFQAVVLGLASWTAMADKAVADRLAVVDEAERLLSRRDEFRGRFGALQAKHAALSRNGAAPAAAEDVASKLKSVLFGGRTPLPEAERLTAEYESLLARASVARN